MATSNLAPCQGPLPPRVALTMGDVAGVGPELIVKAWADPLLHTLARPIVVGDALVLQRALELLQSPARVQVVHEPANAESSTTLIPCIPAPTGSLQLASLAPGRIDPRAGRAAYLFLVQAVELALAGRVDAIATLPLNKKALALGGVDHPGHTEILAERCGVRQHAMMLYLETTAMPRAPRRGTGLGVVHTTLHVSLRQALDLLSIEAVEAKILLADQAMRPLTAGAPPILAVAALNPHAGEDGLFGDEEQKIIAPAVERAASRGVLVDGPHPCDTLFGRALAGAYDAVVAMVHDHGHIALKTAGFHRAVNITLGLPIVRTSVAHGTAYDIAWQGLADPSSLISAVRTAGRIVAGRRILASSTRPEPA